MARSRLPALLKACALAALLGACADAGEEDAVGDEAALARASAERGYDFLVNGDYVGCGVPLTVL